MVRERLRAKQARADQVRFYQKQNPELTQEEIGSLFGMTQQNVSDILNGRKYQPKRNNDSKKVPPSIGRPMSRTRTNAGQEA